MLSVVSTCKLQGYSILEYLKKFFAEITAGNRDYGASVLTDYKYQSNFNLILDIPPEKQGARQNWTLTSE